MKKSLVTFVLALAAFAVAQDATPQQPVPTASARPEIKDPAEYNAYMSALQQQDNAAKVSGFEAFLQQYPNSVMKEQSLEQLMNAYQVTGKSDKVSEVAQKLLVTNPNNARALTMLAFNTRAVAMAKQDPQMLVAAGDAARKCLAALPTAPKPEGMNDADFAKMKTQMGLVCNSVAGTSAMQAKDLKGAEQYLRASVEGDPTNLSDVYNLALAYLTAGPTEDPVNGLFFIARAANLAADPKGKEQITKFGHSKYKNYHGAEDGWAELLTQTATTTLPPAGFTITKYVPPTPAQQAAELVKAKQPKDMSFGEWELVLSEATQADQDTVWNAIKGAPLQMVGKVMSVTPTKIELAGSQDDIDQKKVDLVLTMSGPIPAKLLPKEGQDLPFQGTPDSYTSKPFLMQMTQGALLTTGAPAGAKKPPVHHKPAAR